MENLDEIDVRVDRYLRTRLRRLTVLIERLTKDRRDPRGVRHPHTDCLLALLAGQLSNQKSLRHVERLSQRLKLGRRRAGISDGALAHLLGLSDEHDFDALLVRLVRDAIRRGEVSHPGLGGHWVAIDGKYSTLDHDCGGLAQRFETADHMYWRVGTLRAVVISSPARQALGQWVMPRADVADDGSTKAKHTGEITNLPPFIQQLRERYGEMVSNFTLDAGLWSKKLFLAMDRQGFGLLCGLKNNKPGLLAEVERVLRIERRRRAPQVDGGWETCSRGKIRRRLWSTTALNGYNGWTNLRQVFVIEQTTRHHDGTEKSELRYFVTNTTTGGMSPRRLFRLVRQHWGIENDCNWSFDMQFGEDAGRWCTQNKALPVLGVLRMISYNILQHLRKSHIVVRHVRVAATPRAWSDLFEFIHESLKRQAGFLLALLRPVALLRSPRNLPHQSLSG